MGTIEVPINQSIPVTPGRRWGTPTDAYAVMAAGRRPSTPVLRNAEQHRLVRPFLDVVLPVSTIYAVDLCDAFRQRNPVV